MRYRIHAICFGFCLVLCPLPAGAQEMAVSLEDLPRVLKAGNVVYVTDTAGVRTLGTVRGVSVSALTVAVMQVVRDHGVTTVSTGQDRVFEENVIARISRSDNSGKERALVYPPSWEKLDTLPQRTELAIVLKNGEKRRYRFLGATSDALRLSGGPGDDEMLGKEKIQRIRRRFNDPTIDGIGLGAAISGVTAALLTAASLADCGFSCGTGSDGAAVATTAGMMAGIGAAVGWVIDKAHKGTDEVFPAPSTRAPEIGLQPVVAARERGGRVTLRF